MTSPEASNSAESKGAALNALSPLDMLGFAMRAARRHRILGLSIAVGTIALGLALSKVVPQKYVATSEVLADETFNKTEALSTPDRTLPKLDPFSGSAELLTQKESLISIIDETALIADAEARQLPLMRAKDRFISRLTRRESTLDDRRDEMAKTLASSITIKKAKNLVTIWVKWSNARKALEIAQVTNRKFVALVRDRDTATFSAAISILEDEASRASEAIESALAEAVRTREQIRQAGLAEAAPANSEALRKHLDNKVGMASTPTPTPTPTNETAAAQARQFSAKLAVINGKIQTAEDAWHRQQATLNTHLAELRTVYGQAHPQILQQEALIKAAGLPPAELAELYRSRSELLNEVQNMPERDPRSPTDSSPALGRVRNQPTIAQGGQSIPSAVTPGENLEIAPSKAKLIRAVDNYNAVAGRLASARLQLVASQATFGMRFVVVGKPEYPDRPLRPLRSMVRYAALAIGLLFGFLAGAVRDLVSGRIHESLQLKPFGLKDLGELIVPKPVDR
jgi:uncharacterized protein involved in exopolysaccharide biosynthesis